MDRRRVEGESWVGLQSDECTRGTLAAVLEDGDACAVTARADPTACRSTLLPRTAGANVDGGLVLTHAAENRSHLPLELIVIARRAVRRSAREACVGFGQGAFVVESGCDILHGHTSLLGG